MPILRKCFWIPPLCAPTNTQPAPQKNGDQALGRSRGGLTTKIHSLVEGLGQLARWTLTAGQVHDITQAQGLIQGLSPRFVAADKAFDADAFIAAI